MTSNPDVIEDEEGNQYISTDEAMRRLNIKGHPTLKKLVVSNKLEQFKQPPSKKVYYRENDIEGLKKRQHRVIKITRELDAASRHYQAVYAL